MFRLIQLQSIAIDKTLVNEKHGLSICLYEMWDGHVCTCKVNCLKMFTATLEEVFQKVVIIAHYQSVLLHITHYSRPDLLNTAFPYL